MSNPVIPDASILFEPAKDTYGTRLALVFGNENKEGKCPYTNQCYHCDIGAGEGTQFTHEMNRERLDFFREQYGNILDGVEHLIIYNSGSTLNRKEMSQETLRGILDYASSLQKCKVISLDSREMFITKTSLDYFVDNLREDQQARVILGIETQDDELRIGNLNKRMTKQRIERAFEIFGQYSGKVGIDVNIVFQVPGIVGEDAIEEAIKTAEYSLNLAEKYDVSVDFNFHAYYPSTKSIVRFPNHPRSIIKDEIEAIRRIKRLITERGTSGKIFLGTYDEKHDQEPHLRKLEDIKYKQMFNEFNVTQDVAVFKGN